MTLPASWSDIPCVYRANFYPSGSAVAGGRILIEPLTITVADDADAIPEQYTVTLNATGEIADGFTLPTVGEGVYYRVTERFAGGRAPFTIRVLTTDTEVNLATVAPVVSAPELVSVLGLPAVAAAQAAQAAAETAQAAAEAAQEAAEAASGGTISNAAVNTAIELDEAATRTSLGLGTAATTDATAYATAAQGAKADSAIQSADLATVATSGDYDDLANTPTLGTAAASAATDFASAAQGALADSALQPNTPITGATKTKITYDADGLVTAGADATTADIADSANKRYVTDAQLTVIGNTSGTNTGDQTSVTGNAGTATALATARNIDGQAFDGTANITVIAPGTHAATGKTTPVDADELPLVDSAASNVLKKLTWANLKATLKTYFDTLYAATTVLTTRNTVTAVSSTSGVLASLDYALGDYFTLAMTENVTSWTGFSNLPGSGKGCTIMLRITQHASSAKTMAWPSSFKWADGSAGAISTGLSAVDLLAMTTFDNGTTFRVTLAKAFA